MACSFSHAWAVWNTRFVCDFDVRNGWNTNLLQLWAVVPFGHCILSSAYRSTNTRRFSMMLWAVYWPKIGKNERSTFCEKQLSKPGQSGAHQIRYVARCEMIDIVAFGKAALPFQQPQSAIECYLLAKCWESTQFALHVSGSIGAGTVVERLCWVRCCCFHSAKIQNRTITCRCTGETVGEDSLIWRNSSGMSSAAKRLHAYVASAQNRDSLRDESHNLRAFWCSIPNNVHTVRYDVVSLELC